MRATFLALQSVIEGKPRFCYAVCTAVSAPHILNHLRSKSRTAEVLLLIKARWVTVLTASRNDPF